MFADECKHRAQLATQQSSTRTSFTPTSSLLWMFVPCGWWRARDTAMRETGKRKGFLRFSFTGQVTDTAGSLAVCSRQPDGHQAGAGGAWMAGTHAHAHTQTQTCMPLCPSLRAHTHTRLSLSLSPRRCPQSCLRPASCPACVLKSVELGQGQGISVKDRTATFAFVQPVCAMPLLTCTSRQSLHQAQGEGPVPCEQCPSSCLPS